MGGFNFSQYSQAHKVWKQKIKRIKIYNHTHKDLSWFTLLTRG